jgi:hypothetical protein
MADAVETAPDDYETSTSFMGDLIVTSDFGTVDSAKGEIGLFGGISIGTPPTADAGASYISETSKTLSLSQKLDGILSKRDNDMLFHGIKIKEVSRPSKFVDSWSMWANLRGDETTINADGTFKDKLTYFETGKTVELKGVWYHVTLSENNNPFLLFVYENGQYSFVSYRWNSDDDVYFYYYDKGGHLLSRKIFSLGSNQNILERFLYGRWVRLGYSENIYWNFKKNHQVEIQSYSNETDELLVNKVGEWRLTTHASRVADLSISVENDNFASTSFWSA